MATSSTASSSGAEAPVRVLLVEDSEDDVALFQRAVKSKGWHVEVAKTGRLGLEVAAKGIYDVAVVDYHLQDLTGTEVLLGFKEAGLRFPVVIQSGLDAHFVLARALTLGADGFVSKEDLDYSNALVARIEQAVERGRLQDMVYMHSGSVAVSPVAEIDKIIDDLKERSTGSFDDVGFASTGGFEIRARLRRSGSMSSQSLSALAASLAGSARNFGVGLGLTGASIIRLAFADGTVMIHPVGDFGALFATTAATGSMLEAAVEKFQLAAQELAAILRGVARS